MGFSTNGGFKWQELINQGGHCAVCERTPDQEKHGCLHVDHKHDTDIVRGLLCSNHNTALGLCQDNPDTLEALASYARKEVVIEHSKAS